jgi:tetratricopeptide (TPR) repeat protein
MGDKSVFLLLFLFLIVAALFIIPGSSVFAAEDFELYLAKGIEKINEGQHDEAIEDLKKAESLAPDNIEVAFYLALAYARTGELEQAEALFQKVLEEDESADTVHLELGRIYYIKEECSRSADYLTRYIALTDDEDFKKYAQSLMEECGERGKKEKPYYLNVSAGYQYDDNVIVEPENPTITADAKSDSRVIAYLTGGATLLDKGVMHFKTEYDFYQSAHFDLSDFDIHYHRIKPKLEFQVSDIIKPAVGYAYEYTMLGGDRYGGTHVYFADISIIEGEKSSTDLKYEHRNFKYWNSKTFPTNSIRSGSQNIIGVKQNYGSGKIKADLYLDGIFNRADANEWSYDGFKAGGELSYRITSPLIITVSAEYGENDYRKDYPGFSEERLDKVQVYSAILTYSFSERFTVYISDDYIRNDSNIFLFDYKRNIVGIYLTVGVL